MTEHFYKRLAVYGKRTWMKIHILAVIEGQAMCKVYKFGRWRYDIEDFTLILAMIELNRYRAEYDRELMHA